MTSYGTPDRRRHLANSPFRPAPTPVVETFKVGDRVSHLRHGLGVVVASSGDSVTLRFESGLVRVNSPFLPLEHL